jgi:hypothetical protein
LAFQTLFLFHVMQWKRLFYLSARLLVM